MCGIAGVCRFDNATVDRHLLCRMTGRLRHRGPDDTRIHIDRQVGLGHARLSIIDIAGGSQPMHIAGRRLWIVFNGEIFNYIELRDELIQKGHQFTTRSDTEVILHLYQQEGEACVQRLNGQWAFAIWDAAQNKLFLSRDRLGIRPLFYTQTAHGFPVCLGDQSAAGVPGCAAGTGPAGSGPDLHVLGHAPAADGIPEHPAASAGAFADRRKRPRSHVGVLAPGISTGGSLAG